MGVCHSTFCPSYNFRKTMPPLWKTKKQVKITKPKPKF
jgi:hypothetical protein